MNNKSADVEIRPAREDELPAAIELLAYTFAQDRAVRSIMAHTGGQHNNVDFARAIYEIQVYGHYFPKGEVDLAIDGGEIVGVGLWARPNKQMSTPKFMALLPKYINLFRRAVPFVARREARTANAHPGFAHWYLFAIAVSSRVQGKGIGSTMLKHGLRRAGDAPVYLEGLHAEVRGSVPLAGLRGARPDRGRRRQAGRPAGGRHVAAYPARRGLA
ncbi:GNAT family N-acetyltransferase [uncultured Corynebacterium sp.]|uniref:GNAT family N-acetyltransferase n=1 Tax=uncultured Corynebacterium sp. TaxID=159447 RepID=UPI0025D4CD79|nr:GNAT family N-acetyltransferase [uncultured Corynebacterium sp.]